MISTPHLLTEWRPARESRISCQVKDAYSFTIWKRLGYKNFHLEDLTETILYLHFTCAINAFSDFGDFLSQVRATCLLRSWDIKCKKIIALIKLRN